MTNSLAGRRLIAVDGKSDLAGPCKGDVCGPIIVLCLHLSVLRSVDLLQHIPLEGQPRQNPRP